MHCTEKVRRRLASWLCILFIGYTAATSFFYHAHYVNGRWIVHSHPYTQAPETGHHTHTQAGFATLACLTAALMTSIAPTLYTEPFTHLSAVIIEAICIALVSQEFLHLSLRGPPVMCPKWRIAALRSTLGLGRLALHPFMNTAL